MANILLTTTCNLSCAYCFAREKMDGKRSHMSMDDVRRVLDFLKKSDYPIFRVMGGEPTLHPEFQSIVQMALQQGFRVDVLSNATWKPQINDFFAGISPNRIFFLLNLDHPSVYSARQWERINENLAAIAGTHKITLSFNLFEVEPRFDYILDVCRTYGIDKVRMSFSLPVLGADNAYLPFDDYPKLASFIVDSVHRAEAQGVSIRLDNAVPLCMFTYEQAGELILKGVLDLEYNTHCKPIVDIGPDLRVWSCFCLSKLDNRHLSEFDNLAQLKSYYQQVWDAFQGKIFPMEACHYCDYKDNWQCQGGCLTHAVEKFGADRLGAIPANQPFLLHDDTLLSMAPDVSVRRYSIPYESYLLKQGLSGKEVEIDGSFGLIVSLLQSGSYSVGEMIQLFLGESSSSGNGVDAMESFSRQLLIEGLTSMLSGLGKEGFLEKESMLEAV